MIKLSTIKPNPKNPRLIKDASFKKLCDNVKSLPKMMALRPIVIDDQGIIQGGNMRFKALLELGYKEVPDDWVKPASAFTEAELRQFQILDNVGFGEWDWDILGNEWDETNLIEWGLDIPGVNDNGFGTDFTLPEGDKAPFQQMTFTLADAQAELIKKALTQVDIHDGTQYGNENGNGNALHQIVLEWEEQRK